MGWLQTNTVRIARLHYFYVAALAGLAIAYDAWKLIPAQALIQRWTVAVGLLAVTTIVWFIARNTNLKPDAYKWLLSLLVLVDIYVAAFMVYAGRGMSSRGVILFAIPIIVSAVILSRSALLATATLSIGAYSYAAIKYFTDHPSEGYKVELYGDLIFYSAIFIIFAGMLWAVIRSLQPKKS